MQLDPTTEPWKIILEYESLLSEVKSLDDDSLVEECEEAYNFYPDQDVTELLLSYWKMRTFFPKDRKILENYYILVHCRLMFGE